MAIALTVWPLLAGFLHLPSAGPIKIKTSDWFILAAVFNFSFPGLQLPSPFLAGFRISISWNSQIIVLWVGKVTKFNLTKIFTTNSFSFVPYWGLRGTDRMETERGEEVLFWRESNQLFSPLPQSPASS
jgi:hypothetical protein